MLEVFIHECEKRKLGHYWSRNVSNLNFPVYACYHPSCGQLSFTSSKFYGVKYITFEDFMMEVLDMNDKKIANETFIDKKLVVTNDGKVTKARLYDTKDHQNKLICEGTASCHDDDKFDIYKGAEIAIKRCKDKYYESMKPMDKWSRFDRGEIKVQVNRSNYLEFMNMLIRKNYIWQDGDALLRWVPVEATGTDRIIIEASFARKDHKTICWGELSDYHNSRKDFVDFSTFKEME